jgi:N-acetylmuramoyl-L-alanine amidase
MGTVMKRTVTMVLLLALCTVSAVWAATSVGLSDSAGRSLGTLSIELRGTEKVVPLEPLASAAEWNVSLRDGAWRILLPDRVVWLKTGCSFARVDGNYIQLRVPPDEWDGSIWIPWGNLIDLFGAKNLPAVVENSVVLHTESSKSAAAPSDSLSDAVPRALEQWMLKTVILDPGHGGKDPGAAGMGGMREKTITLDISKRLASLLEKKGIHALLTRSGDQFVSLQERTRFANQMQGDLFMSIHCNSNRDPSIQGVEAYFLKPARTAKAVDAAMRENSVVKLESDSREYRDLTEENYILLTMATSQYLKDSETWADRVIRQGMSVVGLSNRGVDQAGFYVLMGASMPAVLVECGYLSNADDAALLRSERGRQKMAEALMESILQMKKKLESSASR